MAETNCMYFTKFGLALYFKRMLVNRVKASGPLSLSLMKALTGPTKNKKDGYRQQNVRQRQILISIRGHSRSLKLMPFNSLGAVSYSPSIVTMAISAAIF